MLKTVITRTVAAIAITAAASTAALATGDTGNFTPANVSPTAPLDTIAVDPAANTLAEVNRQLAALGDGAETELLQRCAVINRYDENYDRTIVIFCHRALVAVGTLPVDPNGGTIADDNDAL